MEPAKGNAAENMFAMYAMPRAWTSQKEPNYIILYRSFQVGTFA